MANALKTLFGDIAAAIKEKTGETATMKPAEFPAKIAAIPVGGGGSAAGAVTVTFCNYDGTELYSRQVFIGDDCPDPVTQGKIGTPTKASTAQYYYTHNGWSTTEGGSASTSALKSITADKTVYAAFKETVRTYTVRFFDGDTVMKTETVAYGSKATPPDTEKEGFSFTGWTPSDLTIYADTDFFGAWEVDAGWIVWKEFPKETITTTENSNNRVAYSPDGSKLFVGSDNMLYIYDATVQPYNLLKTYSLYKNTNRKAEHITFNSDGSLVAVATSYSSGYLPDNVLVYTVNGSTLTQLTISATSTGAAYRVAAMAFNPKKSELFVAWSNGGKYALIDTSDVSKSLPSTIITSTSFSILGMAYTPDGEKLIINGTTYSAQSARVLDALNGYQEIDQTLTFGSTRFISDYVSVSPDGKYAAFTGPGSSDRNELTIFDISTTPYTKYKEFDLGKFSYNSIYGRYTAFSHDGSLLIVGTSHTPYIKIYDTVTWTIKDPPMQLPSSSPYSISLNHDDTRLAMSVGNADRVNLYELRR